MRTPASYPTRYTQPLAAWGSVFALLLAATAGGYALDHRVSLTSQAMLYVLVVVIASYTLEFLPSLVCALAAVTAFNFFFVPPRWTFAVDNQEHLIALAVMLMVALVINHLAAGLRRETAFAHLNAQRANQLQELATALAGAGTSLEVSSLGQQALDAAFRGPSTLALLGSDGDLEGVSGLDPSLVDGLRCCMHEAAVLGPGTGRWPGLEAWYLPLGNRAQMHGAVCIRDILAADVVGREHAQALCALLAQTLWRLKLTVAVEASKAEGLRQQTQSTFLAAISHDLRTPLAALVGSASLLQAQGDRLQAGEQDQLLGSIVREARYLSRITENTLQLVQLTNAAQPLRHDWESMEEIVGAALAHARQRDPQRRIASSVPGRLPLIQADPVLLAQLIGNLLDNALKYSAGSIDLVVELQADAMLVSVKDRGEAIPADLHRSIFEPYARNDRSGQRGAGLGLALCRAIADAHAGRLTLHPRSGGGNSFTLAMPIHPQPPQGGPP